MNALAKIFELDAGKALHRWGLLTRREREVAQHMALDVSNRDIARLLGISTKTLDIHRTNVKTKLEANTAAGVARVVFLLRAQEAG